MISQFVSRLAQKDDRFSWRKHLSMIRALRQWQHDVEQFPLLEQTAGDVTAYVANFNRPQNIALIVRSLLACPSVGRIVVSNNNPGCHLERWFRPENNRITVLHHAEPQSCSMRYVHLRTFSSPFYFIVDDDVFLLPSQIEQLIDELRADPSVPHGLYGQQWKDTFFQGGFEQFEGTIDIMSRIYSFSSEHLAQVFRTAAAVGHPEGADHWKRSRFDDMFLSFSGNGKPRIHNVGPFVDCPTQGRRGTATWREDDFHREREEMYRQLIAVRPLPV